ncbi:MAG: hypothetical protein AAGA56_06415 [Myxococcota bacterium]
MSSSFPRGRWVVLAIASLAIVGCTKQRPEPEADRASSKIEEMAAPAAVTPDASPAEVVEASADEVEVAAPAAEEAELEMDAEADEADLDEGF